MLSYPVGLLSRHTVRIDGFVDAAPAEVWQALTTRDRLAAWLADEVAIEPRAGGAIMLRFGPQAVFEGRILVFEPPRRLECALRRDAEGESVLRFELAPGRAGTTRVNLHHTLLPEHAVSGYGAGWHTHLDQLNCHLGGAAPMDWPSRYHELHELYQAVARSG